MKKNFLKGFTLVELIVVITILAILGTLGFVYYNNYTVDARDSARISDVTTIEKALSIYVTKTGEYPDVTDATDIVYSGGVLWSQGVYGEDTIKNIRNMSEAPIDPLWGNYYTYSVDDKKTSYNLAYVLEGAYKSTAYTPIITKTYAGNLKEYTAKVSGDYNGQIIATSTGGKVYVFAVPTLIVSDLSNPNVLNLNDKFVYNNELNLPPVYSGTLRTAGSFQFTPTLIYSGAYLPRTPSQLKSLIVNLKDAISGTILYSDPHYKEIVELDINDANDLFDYGQRYINEELGGRFELKYPKNCKEIQNSDDNNGSGFYTISTTGNTKTEVYCDMDTDGGGWTRIRKWDRVNGTTEGTDIRKTRGFVGSEVMVTYTRYGTVRRGGVDYDTTGKKYGYQYKTFKTKQNQEGGFCGEHTTISDLVNHITGGSWGDCTRSGDQSTEYSDILVDDLGENIGLTDDKVLPGFDPDPCINNGHKTTPRNVAWFADGRIEHRIDSSTSLVFLGGQTTRCNGSADGSHGFDTMEVWVR